MNKTGSLIFEEIKQDQLNADHSRKSSVVEIHGKKKLKLDDLEFVL